MDDKGNGSSPGLAGVLPVPLVSLHIIMDPTSVNYFAESLKMMDKIASASLLVMCGSGGVLRGFGFTGRDTTKVNKFHLTLPPTWFTIVKLHKGETCAFVVWSDTITSICMDKHMAKSAIS